MSGTPDRKLARAWSALVVALALHVLDEASTGFLDLYNPTVLSIRARLPWFPAPTFSYGIWLAGLVAAIAALALLTPLVRRATALSRLGAFVFGGVMLLNGFGHLGGSAFTGRWLPGATSSPLLIAASLLLLARARQSRANVGRSPQGQASL